jgi:hypothetical protein
VLNGLGHDAFIGCDDQQHEVNAMGSGEHVFDEPLVTGHIHESKLPAAIGPVGKTQINRHAAPLFFGQPVRVGASQCLDKRSLAVVNVTGCTNNDAAFHYRLLIPLGLVKLAKKGRLFLPGWL